MNNKYAFIIQARRGSTRLPDKILLPFYKGKTILDLQLESIREAFPDVPVILATTINKADEVLADKYTNWAGLDIFRGDENNVLKRFIDAAKVFGVENIIRICSDNPFLSMSYCAVMIDEYFKTHPDYVSFNFNNGTPAIRSHSGLFAEMVSLKTLEKVMQSTSEPLYMEHVTNYIYNNPIDFHLDFIPAPEFIDRYIDKLRLTIDTYLDFVSLQKLYLAVLNKYGSEFTVEQLIAEVESDTELVKSMSEQIRQYAK
jgi:spore coat polysaccharide biosynthesis protein SpsF (cytidylyltransferase family)